MRRLKICLAGFGLSLVCVGAVAQTGLSGGQTIAIQNSKSECVVPSVSSVSMTITSVRVPSNSPWPTWLVNTKAMGAKVDLSVDGPSGTGKRASFPIGKLVTQIKPDNSAPIIRATLNIAVLTKYKLSDKDGSFSRIDMPLTLVRVDDNQGMKKLFEALSKVTEGIRLPPSPFEPGVRAFGAFFSDIFVANTNDASAYPNAILGFELADDAEGCKNNAQALRSGAQAQIFSSTRKGEGIIDIGAYEKYCFYSSQEADPNIRFVDKPADGVCSAKPPVTFKTLNNPQVIFVVNTYPILPITKPASVDVAANTPNVADRIESLSTETFSKFAAQMQRGTKVSEKTITAGDFASMKSKISTTINKSFAGVSSKKLTPTERGALSLSEAIANCRLVGLEAKVCN